MTDTGGEPEVSVYEALKWVRQPQFSTDFEHLFGPKSGLL
jgi:hypothetical protein